MSELSAQHLECETTTLSQLSFITYLYIFVLAYSKQQQQQQQHNNNNCQLLFLSIIFGAVTMSYL